MLTPAWAPLRYHPDQSKLYRTKSQFVQVAAGRGSGKTEIARRYIVRMLPVKKNIDGSPKTWVDPFYFYALPTYAQAKRVAWRQILSLIPKQWIKGEPNKTELMIETVFGSTLYILGMDKPSRAEGIQWDGGIVDEACDQKPELDRTLMPALTHRNAWRWDIGVPKRFGVGAAKFREKFERGTLGVNSFTWTSETVLTPEQIRKLKRELDEKDYNEQALAKWETPGGLVFYSFDEQLNRSDETYNPNLPLYVGSDFNVNPMAWAVAQKFGSELHFIDELYIRDTNTQATLDELHNRYPNHNAGWEFYGDASGKARDTSASETDYIQILNDRRFKNKSVNYPSSNPPQRDRFASANAQFRNALGERNTFISPNCRYTIADFRKRSYKPGTSLLADVAGSDDGHASDAASYLIHGLFPLLIDEPEQSPGVFTFGGR